LGPDTIRRMIAPGQDAPDPALPDHDERAIELSES
jgi:hypothetical protein